ALVEEAAAAAQSLKEQSARLAETVSVFNLGSSQRMAGGARQGAAGSAAASCQRALAVA
ncbi:methyl-accepting chemotaxis protein, partial [Acinetobacter baumannii]|nr:methyl-accepting chemotaxis protein [Acinetobacter baumannii]